MFPGHHLILEAFVYSCLIFQSLECWLRTDTLHYQFIAFTVDRFSTYFPVRTYSWNLTCTIAYMVMYLSEDRLFCLVFFSPRKEVIYICSRLCYSEIIASSEVLFNNFELNMKLNFPHLNRWPFSQLIMFQYYIFTRYAPLAPLSMKLQIFFYRVFIDKSHTS